MAGQLSVISRDGIELVPLADNDGGLFVEIGIEHPHLDDPRNGQFVAGGRMTDGFRRGTVVHTERMFAIRCDVGTEPRNAVLGVVADDLAA